MKKYIFYPGGNRTILIDNTKNYLNSVDYQSIANQNLSSEIEQVGFIEKGKTTDYKLQMMGGEFCINALRCLAKLIDRPSIQLESSGTDEIIKLESQQWVQIELKIKADISKYEPSITKVEIPGITHFVWETENFSKEKFLKKITQIINIYGEERNAIGLIGLNQDNEIMPLIWVKETNSMIFETACGSGSLACFCTQAKKQSCFIQPSGFTYLCQQKENRLFLSSQII